MFQRPSKKNAGLCNTWAINITIICLLTAVHVPTMIVIAGTSYRPNVVSIRYQFFRAGYYNTRAHDTSEITFAKVGLWSLVIRIITVVRQRRQTTSPRAPIITKRYRNQFPLLSNSRDRII